MPKCHLGLLESISLCRGMAQIGSLTTKYGTENQRTNKGSFSTEIGFQHIYTIHLYSFYWEKGMYFKCAVIYNAEAEFNYSLVLILLSPSE